MTLPANGPWLCRPQLVTSESYAMRLIFITETHRCCVCMCWAGGGNKEANALVNWGHKTRNIPKPVPANLPMPHCPRGLVLPILYAFIFNIFHSSLFFSLYYFMSHTFLTKKVSCETLLQMVNGL